jgi:hypothetical protein
MKGSETIELAIHRYQSGEITTTAISNVVLKLQPICNLTTSHIGV